jgi:hypothetical protein
MFALTRIADASVVDAGRARLGAVGGVIGKSVSFPSPCSAMRRST